MHFTTNYRKQVKGTIARVNVDFCIILIRNKKATPECILCSVTIDMLMKHDKILSMTLFSHHLTNNYCSNNVNANAYVNPDHSSMKSYNKVNISTNANANYDIDADADSAAITKTFVDCTTPPIQMFKVVKGIHFDSKSTL